MANLLKSLFGDSGKKKKPNNVPENITETKKCLRCLRRISIEYVRCPHCRSDDFNN